MKRKSAFSSSIKQLLAQSVEHSQIRRDTGDLVQISGGSFARRHPPRSHPVSCQSAAGRHAAFSDLHAP